VNPELNDPAAPDSSSTVSPSPAPSQSCPAAPLVGMPTVWQGVWETLRLAAPTVATMVSYTAMQFVDALMVSRIEPPDPVYVTAQGNGGVWAFMPLSFLMGMLGVVNTYVAQNLGAGKPERGAAYAWNALWMAAGASLLLIPYALTLPALFATEWLNHSPQLQELETAYAQVLLFGAFLTLGTRALAQYFYGLHRPAVVLVAALAGNLTNVLANWVLIYGRPELGIPAMGVTGAALGTLVGTAVELSIPLAVFLSPTFNRLYHTRRAWRPSLAHIRDIFKIGWPASIMFGNEMICWAIFMTVLAGRFGEEHNAAGWIVLRYMHLSFMPAVGLSFAATAMVGRAIGAGRHDLASRYAMTVTAIAGGYMLICAVCFVVFRESMIAVFLKEGTPPEEAAAIIAIGAKVLIVAAVFQLFDGVGITLIGALRGAGDTKVPSVVTIVLAWVCIIGVGTALVVWAPGLESLGPWIGAGLYIVALGIFLTFRWLGGAWKNMKLLEGSAAAAAH